MAKRKDSSLLMVFLSSLLLISSTISSAIKEKTDYPTIHSKSPLRKRRTLTVAKSLLDKDEVTETNMVENQENQCLAIGSYHHNDIPGPMMVKGWERVGEPISRFLKIVRTRLLTISANGRVIAAGEPSSTHSSGEVLVFSFSEQEKKWERRGQTIKGLSLGKDGGRFVSSMELSADGNILVTGGTSRGRFLGDQGYRLKQNTYVRVFRFNSTSDSWEKMGNNIIKGKDDFGGSFGMSVSISADGMTVAAGGSDSTGLTDAAVFKFNGTWWEQIGQDISGEDGSIPPGEVALSADGHTLAVRRRYFDQQADDKIRVYSLAEDSSWIQVGQTLSTEETEFVETHMDLSGNGRILAISEPTARLSRVFSFHEGKGTWIQMGQELDFENTGRYFGDQISISDDGCTLSAVTYDSLDKQYLRKNRGVIVMSFDGKKWMPSDGDAVYPAISVDISGNGRTLVVVDRSTVVSGRFFLQQNVTVFDLH